MIRGTVEIKLRPIKSAFLVNPEDKVSLQQAIEINTFLWGGMYNPIIPTYKELPTEWQDAPFVGNPSPQELVSGYLDNFDPDYVIPMGECVDYDIDVGDFNKISDVSEILDSIETEGVPTYGIGLFEVSAYFFEKELKFHRKYPLKMCVPQFGGDFDLFFASVFGKLPESIETIFWEHVANDFETEKIDCSASNYVELLEFPLFLRLMTRLDLTHSGNYEDCVYLLDATKPIDIIDYWNLRAIGWKVFGVPKQFSQDDIVQKTVQRIIENNYDYYDQPVKSQFYRPITLLKSRFVSEDEHRQFVDSLGISLSDVPNEGKGPKYLLQTSYPRIWDEWARRYDHVECCNIESDTAEHDISTNEATISVKTLEPKFSHHLFTGLGEPRFANEFDLRLYGDKELLADVIPKGDLHLASVISRYDRRNWRISRKGLVYLSKRSERVLGLFIPEAELIFTRWLELQGWTVTLTSPGKIAKQMLHQLDGIDGTWILARRGIIQLLGEMSSYANILKKVPEELTKLQASLQQNGIQESTDDIEGFVKHLKAIEPQLADDKRPMLVSTFWGRLKEIAGKPLEKEKRLSNEVYKQRVDIQAKQIRRKLIDSNALQLGLEVQCTVCNKRSWYSLKSADYELQCPECHAQFSFPQNIEDIQWAYRTLGAFSSSKQADGAYTVLLTLRFFTELLDGATTPLMSFELQKAGKNLLEADLGLLFQRSKFHESETKIIFAECKTFNVFREKDIARMTDLGNAFPGAVLVFAKLSESFNDNEKALLIPFVEASWKRYDKNQPYNPILILTGKELYLDSLWESHLDRYTDLLDICTLTQELYLGRDFRGDQYNSVAQRTTWLPADELSDEK